MSDWHRLNECRVKRGMFGSDPSDGFNGAFVLVINGLKIRCIASDGMGWQHVSVSHTQSDMPPSWSVMSQVKDLFWETEDCVIQFHPPHSKYVNNHPGCLHLWRCTDGRQQPMPEEIMVGIKESGNYRQNPGKAVEDFIRLNSK